MDGEKPIGQDAGTSGTVISVEVVLSGVHSTNSFVRKWIIVRSIGIVEGAADE
jgi:hypothetical protein